MNKSIESAKIRKKFHPTSILSKKLSENLQNVPSVGPEEHFADLYL